MNTNEEFIRSKIVGIDIDEIMRLKYDYLACIN